jgi:hypothetical protein
MVKREEMPVVSIAPLVGHRKSAVPNAKFVVVDRLVERLVVNVKAVLLVMQDMVRILMHHDACSVT